MSNKSSNEFQMIFISIIFVLVSLCTLGTFVSESLYKSSEQGVKYLRARKLLKNLNSAKQVITSGKNIVFDSEDLNGIENEAIITCIEKVQNSALLDNSSKFVDSLIQKATDAVNSELHKPAMEHFANMFYLNRALMVLGILSVCFCFIKGIRQGIIYIKNKSAV